jgi:sugar O-acyltransferase (sialic acid O-acetyltransferase NeuD family)
VWGATGHARVVRPMLERLGHEVTVLVDRSPTVASPFRDVEVVSPDRLDELIDRASLFVLAMGGTRGPDRLELAEMLMGRGLQPLTLVHHRAWVADDAAVGAGAQVGAMAAVGVAVTLGPQTIVNTGAVLDHESVLGAGVHVMPGAALAGLVRVADCASIGTNATVLPRVSIGEGAVVGAGSVVTKDVAAGTTVVGAPARVLTRGTSGT